MTPTVFILYKYTKSSGTRLTQILYIHSRLKWAEKSHWGEQTQQLKG